MPGWDDLSPAPPARGKEPPRAPGYAEAFNRGLRESAPPTSDAWEKLSPAAPAPIPPPASRSIWDRIIGDDPARDLNRGTGKLVDGAGAFVGFLANPLNTVLNAALPGAPLPTDVGTGWGEALGFEQPRNQYERLEGDVITGAAAGLAGAGAMAPMAARAAPGLATSFLQFLADAPVVNTIAGGTGGGSAGVAREMGYGPVGQTVAGLAGGLAGGVAAARIGRPRAPGMPPDDLVDGALDSGGLPVDPRAPASGWRRPGEDIVDAEFYDIVDPALPAPAPRLPAPPARASEAPLALPAPLQALADLRGEPGAAANSNRSAPVGRTGDSEAPDVIAPAPYRPAPAPLIPGDGSAPAATTLPGRLLASTSDQRGPADVWARIAARRDAANDLDLPAIPYRPLRYDVPDVAPPAAGIGSRARMVAITESTESGGRRFGADGKLLTSSKGARGEMQVMPGTERDPGYGVTPARDGSPDELARVGRDYLAALTRHYGGDPAKGWAAYNAGPGRLDRAIRIGGDGWLARMPAETRAYVEKNMAALGGDGPISTTAPAAARTADFRGSETDFLAPSERFATASAAPPTGPDPLAAPPALPTPEPSRSLTTTSTPRMEMRQFRPSDIEADAGLMQFKEGGDAEGVTDQLRGVQAWDNALTDPIMVWEGADGRRLVADGHQRLGLAKRLEANGHDPITLDAKVMHEANGITPREARTVAALANMAKDRGTPTDAAKVIREMGRDAFDQWRGRLSTKESAVRIGSDLAVLSDEAFGAVVNKVVSERNAAAIGRVLPDRPEAHMAMVEAMQKVSPRSEWEAEALVRQMDQAGYTNTEQMGLFGTDDRVTARFALKARLISDARSSLERLGKLYGTAAREADTLANVRGNRIQAGASAKEATANVQSADIVQRLAFRPGPVADALERAARSVEAGGSRADAVRQFVADARAIRPDDVTGERAAGDRDVARLPGGDEPGAGTASADEPGLFGDAPTPADQRALVAPESTSGRKPTTLDALDDVLAGKVPDRAVAAELAERGFLVEKDGGYQLTPRGRHYLLKAGRDASDGESGFIRMGSAADWAAIRNDGAALLAKVKQVYGSPVAALKSTVARVGQFGEATLYSADASLRSMSARTGAPTIAKVADLFHSRAGAPDGTGRTYHEAVDRATRTRTQQLYDTLEPFLKDKAALGRIRDLLATPTANLRATAKERAAATQVRDLLKDTLEYRRDAGESIGEVGDGYFPRVIDAMKVARDPAAFIKAAERVYRAAGAADPTASATAWAQRVGDTHAGIDGGLENIKPGSTPNSAKAREFGKLADTMLRDFYNTDPFDALASYIAGSARKAEQARRFGPKGREGSPERLAWIKQHGRDASQWSVMMDQIKTELRASAGDVAGVPDDVLRIRDANLGRLYQSAGNTVSLLHSWNTLSVMDRATVTSLGDLAMGFVRGGPRYGFGHLATSLNEFGRRLAGAADSDATRYAEALGVANDAYGSALLQARADGGTKLAVGSKAVDGFYRATGLQQLTEAGRVAATKTGQRFLADLAADMVSTNARTRSRAASYLRELGVKDPDAFAAELRQGAPTRSELIGDQGFAADYATALMRYVEQSILMPTKAQRPTWTNHPVGSLFFALQSYAYGFKKNVLDRVGRETAAAVRERDPHRLAAASGLAILAGVTYVNDTYVRPALFGKRHEIKDEGPLGAALRVADRAGALGPLSLLYNAFTSIRYQRSPVASLAGPVIGRIGDGAYRIGKATFFDSPGTNTDERNAAAAVYDLAVEPALDLGAVRYLRGPARTVAVEATGNRSGDGLLPGDREAFTSAMVGPKAE